MVIGVAIGVSGIGAKILMIMTPKGSDLVLSAFTWWYWPEDDGLIIHVKGSVVNIGTEPMNITSVYLVVKNRKYYLDFRRIEYLLPGDINEIVGKTKVSNLPETNLLTIVVEYCIPRKCSKSIANAKLDAMAYVLNKDMFGGSTTVTVPQTVTTTVVQTVTQTEQ